MVDSRRALFYFWLVSVYLAFVSILAASLPAGGAYLCPSELADAGSARWYTGAPNAGACSLDDDDGLFVAIPPAIWNGSALCGECLSVTGPLGSVVVNIVELCSDCGPNMLDLSQPAFESIGDPVQGIIPISWRRVACPTSGPIRFQFEGSNPWYLKLQVRNHAYGVNGVEYFNNGQFHAMTRSADNHFVGMPTPIQVPFAVRVTGSTGESLLETISAITNDVDIPGTTQFQECLQDVIFRNGFQ